jgi:hypothetical protein
MPFRRTRLVLSAVIIGAMAPDFEYFLELAPKSGYGHGWPGVLIVTLPLALLVYWLYETVVKSPLIWLLPSPFRQRLNRDPDNATGVRQRRLAPVIFALIILSLTVGIATHILWDSFTHSTTWVYHHWSFLSHTLTLPVLKKVQYYKLFQHASTLMGIVILALWIGHWYRTTAPDKAALFTPASRRERLLVLALIPALALCGALLRALIGVRKFTSPAVAEQFLGEFVITLIALVWWQLVIYGFVRRKRFSIHRPA